MSAVDLICKKYDFPFPPLDYQRETINKHVEDCITNVGLFWSMGSGKTFSSTLLNMIYRDQTGAQVILICPPILLRQWARFLDRCGISNKVYSGSPTARAAITFDRDTSVFITNIEILKRDFERVSAAFLNRAVAVCVDEATSIKNYDSGNFRAILQLSSGNAISLLTGTPLSTPADAYAYIKLISPNTYRSFSHFENLHVTQRDYFQKVTEWGNLDMMRKNLALRSSFISTPEVHPDMPRARIGELVYDLDKQHMKLYKTLVEQQLLLFDGGGAIDASTPNKLYHATQQIVLGWSYFAQQNDLVPKAFGVLDEMLLQMGNSKLVVSCNYKMSVRAVMLHLEKNNVIAVQVNGDVGQTQKQDNIEKFKTDPKCQVLVLNPQAGGVGVDGLQEVCCAMLFLEIPTLAKTFWQAVARLERPGQKFVTDVRIATALGTIQVRLRAGLIENDGLVNTVVPSVNDLRAALLGK